MDWIPVLKSLLDHGMSQSDIADAVGLKPPSIIDLMSGRQKSVKWDVGNALISLHARVVLAKVGAGNAAKDAA